LECDDSSSLWISVVAVGDFSHRAQDSFNGKPKATMFPAIADAFGLPLND